MRHPQVWRQFVRLEGPRAVQERSDYRRKHDGFGQLLTDRARAGWPRDRRGLYN
jgi:hypothetical protein